MYSATEMQNNNNKKKCRYGRQFSKTEYDASLAKNLYAN